MQQERTYIFFCWPIYVNLYNPEDVRIPRNEMKRGRKVVAEVKGNTILITHCDYPQLTLWLDDDMLNLDKKVTIKYQGRKLFSGKLDRTAENLRQSLTQRGDIRYMFPAKIVLIWTLL